MELQSNREMTINGTPLENDGVQFEEKIFQKQPSLEHQWMAICHLKKLLNRMNHAYERARLERGDISEQSLTNLKKRNAAKAHAADTLRKKPGWM
jgi:hypothetical protein